MSKLSHRAVWRKRADEPRSWVGYFDADRERYLKLPRELLGSVANVLAIYFLFRGKYAAAAGMVLVSILLPRLKRRPARVASLITLPSPAPAFPCEIEVVRGDAALGLDRGAVTFLDGWLHFEGYRTEFSLSRRDVEKLEDGELTLVEGGGVNFSRLPGFASRN